MNPGRSIYDGGTLIATNGKMLASGPRFSFADWLLTTAVVDVTPPAVPRRRAFPDCTARLQRAAPQNGSAEFEYPEVTEPTGTVTTSSGVGESSIGRQRHHVAVPGHPEWETGPHQKEEEFARAVALALFDYLRKSRSQGFVVSLSGGADSSTVAVMVHLLARFGGRELGSRICWQALDIARLIRSSNAFTRKASRVTISSNNY